MPDCPKGHPLTKRPNSFHYRGRSYDVDYCAACNSLWNCPPPEFATDLKAGVFDGTAPGDIVPPRNEKLATSIDAIERNRQSN